MQNQQDIDLIVNQIKEETEHYFEAITRSKDLTVARNIKMKINKLQRILHTNINGNTYAVARIN